jgi:hypothetical protein
MQTNLPPEVRKKSKSIPEHFHGSNNEIFSVGWNVPSGIGIREGLAIFER